jgi:tRNA(Ile2) C34 agmatinyltransferase TiaS
MTKKYYSEIVLVNKIQCRRCGDIIESMNRHDFKWCKCGSVAVDGGKEYLKRCTKEGITYTDLSEVRQEERDPYEWEKT